MDTGHIFLSYSTTDRAFADDLLRRLEAKGVRVWMAPRDVRPGSDYSEAIQDAIETSTAVVALVSDNANHSRHVRAEIEIAFSRDKPLFPVRFNDVTPAKGLALFLGLGHWTDLFGAGEGANLDRLAAELSHPPGGATMPPVPPAPPPPPPPRPAPRPQPAPPQAASMNNRLMIAAICVSLAVILLVVVLALLRHAGPSAEPDNRVARADEDRGAPVQPPPVRNEATPVDPNQTLGPAPVAPVEAGANWIVGSWRMDGEACATVVYTADGNWATNGGGGTWSINGTTLTIVIQYRVREGVRIPRDAPLAVRYEALSITPATVVLRFPDGIGKALYRCS